MKKEEFDIEKLKRRSRSMRENILKMINSAGSGHPGGSLSCIDILNYLYGYHMKHDPKRPDREDRDRFVMSKGHASPAMYAVLGEEGYFNKAEFKNFRKFEALLQGHVYTGVPGVELSTGSLGQGLSAANGMAFGAGLSKNTDPVNVYCLLGDGEMQEGQVWEAIMTAAHHNLDNVCAILDYNGVQENGPVEKIKNLEPLEKKLKDFNWEVVEIDGHNFNQIKEALDRFLKVKERPFFIKANTVKGKGVSFMEGQHIWHGKAPSDAELSKALKEIHNEK
ncbi:MAG: transketolase [Elusimicrobiota bacterium]